MNYNVKNNNIAIIAIAFAVMMAMSQSSFAQQADVQQNAESAQTSDIAADLFGEDLEEDNSAPAQPVAAEAAPKENTAGEIADTLFAEEPLIAENNEVASQEMPAENTEAGVPNSENATNTEAGVPNSENTANTEAATDESLPPAEEPKSPFEKFGNAILTKVDNDLFNQMSKIEKQTTLLNLELKREEVKNRIEALRIQRLKAQEEEQIRKKAEEERLKNEELARKLKIMEAERKIKQKEIELEKVRQAKVLKEYMNEMLVSNQKWVEVNATLLSKIKGLEDERRSLIKDFEDKMSTIRRVAAANAQSAENAKAAHNRMQQSYATQIESLQKANLECQSAVDALQNGDRNVANPFADGSIGGINKDAIDMSDEYAIMDITGKGNNIVAKIVNKEGTTFIVHKGSMLKGGEVVTAITDNYIAFDNKGIKSFLYTGGTVLQFEPTEAFNEAGKTPEISAPVETQTHIRNVRGAAVPSQPTSKAANAAENSNGAKNNSSPTKRSSSGNKATKSTSGIASFSSGMLVR